MRPWSICVFAALIAGFASCQRSEKVSEKPSPPMRYARSYTAMTGEADHSVVRMPPKEAQGQKHSPGPEMGTFTRKVIRNGDIQVLVDTYEPAREAVEALVREVKGYISSSQVHHASGRVSSATLVLKVPANSFPAVMKRVAELGSVLTESTKSDDITEQYYDIRARLENAKRLEARLIELLAKKAGKVSDLLQVEKEIGRVREEVERFEGKLRLWDNLVSLSTLSVQLQMRSTYTPPKPRALADELSDSLDDSLRSMKRLGRDLLRGATALLPWSPLLALGIWLPIRFWRKRRRAKQAPKP
jgi:hypothetical protein